MNVIEFDNVGFGYRAGRPGVLDGVSFAVGEGEFVALVGDNGSGKSTIAKLCDGFLAPDSGSVRVLDLDVGEIAGTDGVFALRRQVGFVFQNPDDQLVASLVVDEVAFGPRNLGLPREEIIERIDAALAAVAMTDAVGCDVNTLSGGQRQRVAIADALAMRPRLLVLDEPTSMIDAQGRTDVMEAVEHLRADGMTVLLITHDPAEAARADRILQMENGAVRERGKDELPALWPDEAAAGELSAVAPAASPVASSIAANSTGPSDEPIIRFENVSFRYDRMSAPAMDLLVSHQNDRLVLDSVNLVVRKGELLAVAGPNGSGKTTLIQHMNGLLRPTEGRVVVAGTDTAAKEGANEARRVVGITFQYPERSFFADNVYDEIAFGPRNLGLSPSVVDERVRTAMERLALPFDRFAQRSPFDLSGGEQRKVAIAGVLATDPRVLVLDEPCAGLDIPSHRHLVELLEQLKSEGQTIVLVTHEEQDIARLADRVFRLE